MHIHGSAIITEYQHFLSTMYIPSDTQKGVQLSLETAHSVLSAWFLTAHSVEVAWLRTADAASVVAFLRIPE